MTVTLFVLIIFECLTLDEEIEALILLKPMH